MFTAYIFFCNDIRARITEENKDKKMTELSKLMGVEWKKLDDEGKQVRLVEHIRWMGARPGQYFSEDHKIETFVDTFVHCPTKNIAVERTKCRSG